jgi:DNA-3-methyladenine glycosylase
MFDRAVLLRPALEVAPLVLGAVLRKGPVELRVTEVEAYLGALDPGSHAFRGKTRRNGTMFGEPGHLYTYFTYGMHVCANVVCSPEGEASGILLRAGRVLTGLDLARSRRTTSKGDDDLARGPARLAVAMGITLADDGTDLAGEEIHLDLPTEQVEWASGPRTGVSGDGGTDAFPWRFWMPGDATVSPYRKSAPKRRR